MDLEALGNFTHKGLESRGGLGKPSGLILSDGRLEFAV
jgi:hypothetical protein